MSKSVMGLSAVVLTSTGSQITKQKRKRWAISPALVLAVAAAIPTVGHAATRTWDGGGVAGTNMDTAVNWSADTVPNGTNSDIAQWDGTVAGALNLTYTAAGTGANLAAGSGIFLNVLGTQTGSLTINEASGTGNLRLQNITIASGAGAFTLGSGDAQNDIIALGTATIDLFNWTNNSSNLATIGSDVRLAYGGGDHDNDMTLAGSGNWVFNAKFGNLGTGSMRSFIKSGAGTLTVTADTRGTNSAAAIFGAGSVFIKQGLAVVDTGGVLWSDNPQTSPGAGSTTAAIGQNGSDIATLTVKGTGQFISGDAGSGDFSLGEAGSAQGTLNIQDTGSVLVDSGAGFFVGSANAASSTATGIVNQSGGTLTTNRTADGNFIIGGRIAGATGTGTYNLSAGTVTNAGRAWIGGYGNGSVVQTGGTWNNGESISIARQAGSTGSYTISAGSLVQTGGTTGIVVGREGTGTLTVSGTGTVSSTSVVTVGGAGTGVGTVNLNGGSITTPAVNSIGGTATFNFNGGTLAATANNANYFAGLTRANVRNGGAVIDTAGFNVGVSQPILHSNLGGDNATDGGLTKNNGGTLTLSGGATYTGPTNVTAGGLSFDTVQATIGSVTVANGATLGAKHTTGSTPTLTTSSLSIGTGGAPNLAFDFNNLSTPTAALITTGAFTASGTVGVTFANASLLSSGSYPLISYSSFAGGGTFPAGTYTFSPRVSGTIFNNGTNALLLNVTADKPLWTGLDNNGTTGNWQVGTTGPNANWKLQTAGTPTDYIEGDAVVFDDSATGVTSVDIAAADVSPVSIVFNNATKPYTISSSGGFGIAGGGLMIKNNTGAVTIANSNSFTGGTTINNGTLNLNAANALGSGTVTLAGGTLNVNNAAGPGTGTVVITGGVLDNTSGSPITLSTNNLQSWNGNFAFAGSNNLNMGNGLVTLGGPGTSRTATVNAGTLTVGRIVGATQGLTKAGAGRLAINTSAASAIAGQLNVTGGILQINTGVDSGTTNDFQATGLAGTGTIENGGGVERWLYINTGGSETFNGTLQDGSGGGALGLNKQGIGTLTLAGASTYTGTTTLSAGTLVAANTAALGNTLRLNAVANLSTTFIYATNGGDNVVPLGLSTGATTVLNVVSDRATPGAAVNRTMTVPSTSGLGGGTINFTAGVNVTSGTPQITFTELGLGAGSTQTTTLNPTGVDLSVGNVSKVSGAGNQTIALDGTTAGNEVTGIISNGITTVSLTKTNTSTWKLSGANFYTGTTTLTGGTLIAGSTSALGFTDRLNVINTTGGGPSFVYGTDGGDAVVPIGLGTGAVFTVVSDRATPGAAVDRTMTVPAGAGLGGGTINFTAGPNVTSGTPKITFTTIGMGAGSGSTTTLNPTGVNLSVGDISKFNNTPAQTIELGGTTTGNEVTGNITNGTATVSVRKSGTSTWTLTGANTYTGGTVINSGTLRFQGGGTVGVASSNVTNNGTLQVYSNNTIGNVTGTGTSTIGDGATAATVEAKRFLQGTLGVGSVSTLKITPAADLFTSAGVSPSVSNVTSLSVGGSGKLNLTNTRIVTNDPQGTKTGVTYSGILGLVQTGRNGGTWNGPGINTDQADAVANKTSIGVATATEAKGLTGGATTLWSGQTIDANDTLIMYTYAGDANLDGTITADDYASIDLYFLAGGQGTWYRGDFNYDGAITADDYALIDSAFLANSTPLWVKDGPRGIGGGTVALSAVPEPASLGVIGVIAGAGLLRRRRRS